MTPQEFAAMGLAAQKKTSPTGTASPTLLSNTPINPSPVPTLAQITSNPSFVNYDPNGGMQAFNDTWGNDYTYRDPSGAKKPFRASSWDTVVASANKNGGNVDHLTSILKPFADKQYANDQMIWNRRDNNAIFKELTSNPVYSGLANKGLTQAQVAETMAAKLAAYGITDLNQLGVANGGKFYSKLTGKEIPKDFGYTTWGNGLNNFSLQVTPDGRVVPTTTWEKTGMSTGGILGALTAVGAGLAAPWAVPALGGALGVGGVAAGGLYGAGAGALSSGLSGNDIFTGALTGGVTGAVGGGLLDSITSGTNLPDVSSLNSGLDFSNVDDLIQGGSITSGQGASTLINAAPIGTNIAGVTGGALNPVLSVGAGALGNLATSDLVSLTNNFQAPSSISPVGESTGLNNTGTGLSDTPTGQITNLGTDMITSPENLQSLVNSSPIGSELLPGTPGSTGGYLNPTMAAGSGVAAAAQGTGSITDYISNLFNSGVDNFMKDPVKNTGTVLSGLVSYLQGQDQAGDLSKLLKNSLAQADPFGSQRAYYAQKLKDTYTNPVGVQNSPEYQAVRAKELDALERADAAQGRRSQYGARAEKMNQNFMEYLNKERSTLAGLAGASISPNQVASLATNLGVGSSNAQVNSTGQLMFALNQLLNGGK